MKSDFKVRKPFGKHFFTFFLCEKIEKNKIKNDSISQTCKNFRF